MLLAKRDPMPWFFYSQKTILATLSPLSSNYSSVIPYDF